MYLPIPIDLLPLLFVAVIGTALAVRSGAAAVRRDRARTRHAQTGTQTGTQAATQARGTAAQQPDPASTGSRLLDIELEALSAMRQVDGLAARHRVRLQIAIQPDLSVRADPRGFRRALIDLLANAIGHAPGGKVMLGGMRHGGRIQIAVLDDGQGPDRLEQEAVLRSVESIVALHGGTLQIDSRPGQGTLVILRLPEPLSASSKSAKPPGVAPGDNATETSPKSAASSREAMA